ncbi:MAG: ETC complex I subunit [Pseudomonadota bacterium]|uniref:ETC complex I subunit n=1 Tax=unclassified Phenylobacterium TaxID=2640670 RepID=UPI0006FA3A4F|nr:MULTISPECIES: ETC complex I subunit [unclassified Phenylobacterium]KRB44392.1 ETC complex I subunit [Phenylobacterium sp. Root700]MBT9472431.1 ETC complex I subunit [Phenylobacterium sp.]
MLARIYRPAKNAMQSGKAKTKDWVLEFEPASALRSDPLMGWTLTADMDGQIRLAFETKDEAVAYAQAHGIAFQISDPKPAKRIIKAYADNFAFGRKQPWTH